MNDLAGVSCVSPVDCVAVGTYTDSAGDPKGFAEIWNGTAWSVALTSTPALGGDDSSLGAYLALTHPPYSAWPSAS
jgi:hypothetical protein